MTSKKILDDLDKILRDVGKTSLSEKDYETLKKELQKLITRKE